MTLKMPEASTLSNQHSRTTARFVTLGISTIVSIEVSLRRARLWLPHQILSRSFWKLLPMEVQNSVTLHDLKFLMTMGKSDRVKGFALQQIKRESTV